jgi:hypothetical protein
MTFGLYLILNSPTFPSTLLYSRQISSKIIEMMNLLTKQDIKVSAEIFVPKHTSFKSKRVPRSYLFLGRRFTMVKNGFS